MPNVEYILPALSCKLRQYETIADCLEGEEAVKAKSIVYLPKPAPEDVSDENRLRYEGYRARAVFYNVAQRTLGGLVGQIFSRDPEVKVPSRLDILVADVDGLGTTAVQQAKQACGLTIAYSRAGLLVDMPDTGGKTISVAQLEAGEIRPTLSLYGPRNIINWRTKKRGAKSVLSLVVLFERYEEDTATSDGFEPECGDQYRVLRLEDDMYVMEVYRDGKLYGDRVEPKGPDGKRLNEIPFVFMGVEANNPTVEAPAFFALCSLNMAHYRNSADHEEMLFICGQATPIASGLTAEWAEKFGEIKLGSRNGILLPEQGKFELVQAEERSAISAEMEHKEQQMVALGAKLVEQKQVQRTATEASQDEAAESSVLSSTAKNVGAAYQWAFEWAAYLMGLGDRTTAGAKSAIEFNLNSEFDLVNLDSAERSQLMKEWQAGAITDREYRTSLTRAGIAEEKFDEWERNRDENADREVVNAAKAEAALVAAAGGTTAEAE